MFIYTCFTLCPQCVAVSGTHASVLNPNFGPQVVPVYPQPSSSMVRDSLPQWLEAEIAGLKWRFVFWDFAIVHHSPQLAPIIVPNLPLCTRQSGLLREALAEPMWQVGDLGVYDVRRERERERDHQVRKCQENSVAYFRT